MSGEAVTIIGMDEVINYVKGLPKAFQPVVKDAFKVSAFRLQAKMIVRTNGNPLKRRTGQLGRSFKTDSYGKSLNTTGAAVSTTSPYARIHETGGTVTAKRAFAGLPGGPYLSIPSNENRTPAGITRLSPRDAFTQRAHIRKIGAPKAKYAIFSTAGIPLFWLVKSITIKAQLGFENAGQDEVPTLLSNMKAAVDMGLN